jgi:SpoVK/Ycf46/Vps4 family AAA+-type ATPase
VESRIVIDCAAYNTSNPNSAVRLSQLENLKAGSTKVHAQEQLYSDDEDDDGYDDYSEDDMNGYDCSSDQKNIESSSVPKQRRLNMRELLMAVPFARGYALKTKKWLEFFIDKIVPITFNEKAFESLVLPAEQKELILAFVESQVRHKDAFDDVIAGKGRGMIFMLSGPPGVGKTLTAESVAENMRSPLYTMSAGDLGLEPSRIESSLTTILELVAKWNAVLLLDEADVFLEARNTSDLERNKLVSIFLRMLEYYEGILFLTTNRVKQIDDAFHSRIHVSLHYPSLNDISRRQIWKTFCSHLNDAELNTVATVDLNGRQIKNVLKTAQLLAKRGKNDGGKVEMGHINTVLAIEGKKHFG